MEHEKNSIRPKGRNPFLAITALAVVSILVIVGFSGCTSQQKADHIRIDGAFALQPMMIKWTDEYHKLHTNVTFDVQAEGAGIGMNLLLANQIDLAMVSRALNSSEISKGAVYVSCCRDAVFATINSQNPVYNLIITHGVNKTQFKHIFIDNTYKTWGQLYNTSSTAPIDVYTRGDPGCGAADTWAKFIGKYKQGDLGGTFAKAAPTGDVDMARDIVADPNGIGYNNMAFIYNPDGSFQYNGSLRPVPIDLNADGTLNTTENFYTSHTALTSAINTGFLPAPPSRVENLAVNHNFTGPTKTFVLWILQQTGGQQYVASNGYVQLTSDTLQKQITYIETGVQQQ